MTPPPDQPTMPPPASPHTVTSANNAVVPTTEHQRKPKAAEYAARDLAILWFALRYGIALNCTVSAAIFEGLECGHVLRKLSDRGWLERYSGALPGGLSYFRLTPKGGQQIGVDVKPKSLGAVALNGAIATSAFCVVDGGGVRQRILPNELAAVSGALPGNVPHVVTTELGEPAVLRVQFAASGKTKEVRKKAAAFVTKSRSDVRLAPQIATAQLGVAILGHTPERVAELANAFAVDDRFSGVPTVVGLGPVSATLASCLRNLRVSRAVK